MNDPSYYRRQPDATTRAFTLVELLVSIALTLLVVSIATAAITQLLTQTRRMQSRLALDATASVARGKLYREVGSMHPCAAVWLNSKASERSVELVFMRMAYSTLDFPTVNPPPATATKRMNTTEQFWTRWSWSFDSKTLMVANSRPLRLFRIPASQSRNYWKIPGGSKMPSGMFSTFLSIPQLQRDPGIAGPQPLLDSNIWLPDSDPTKQEQQDVGDYQDLLLNAKPLLANCTELTLEITSLDGSSRRADGNSDLSWAAPGSYVDGQDQPDLLLRPSLLRLRFTLTDDRTGAISTYSFSCTTPSQPAY